MMNMGTKESDFDILLQFCKECNGDIQAVLDKYSAL